MSSAQLLLMSVAMELGLCGPIKQIFLKFDYNLDYDIYFSKIIQDFIIDNYYTSFINRSQPCSSNLL